MALPRTTTTASPLFRPSTPRNTSFLVPSDGGDDGDGQIASTSNVHFTVVVVEEQNAGTFGTASMLLLEVGLLGFPIVFIIVVALALE
mmetsp:Transcript_21155/g.31392  ORF Transcript_21155/g.31392 Transcript_21155/m.31392 type:complete len:88 (-) Transcript_21155:1328-1591(-)|eukprot:CAMPEP_0194034950 /NCGR_PEP_ID=MMETSP0009_2-20130614/7404_1 /TAXON_ID=210454 /ORGANISM="Grammatophora oceanica, Strain CCMP 410" /LENGTH=87 /DNA_ID=CAMNT_0038676115 /DNA_START=604 /DNA_END=867 /DNA_ORIENTATION=-